VAGAIDRASSADSRPSFGGRSLSSTGIPPWEPHGPGALRSALRAFAPNPAANARRRRTAASRRHRPAGRPSRCAGLAACDCLRCAMRLGFRALYRKKCGARRRDAGTRADGIDGDYVRRRPRRPALRVGGLRLQTAPGGAANDRNCGSKVTAGPHRAFEV
jgi:hypothetical protein